MIVKLKTGLKVKVWSDNPDCTLHVYDAGIDFDPEVNITTKVNYSDIHPDDLKKLAFYKYDPDCTCGNTSFGFDCVCSHTNNNPGDEEYTCEFCGIYTASKPRCNKCEKSI